MRDKQASAEVLSGGIPVISPVLHFLAMPVLVFWRRGFGYAFLSPKSVFLSTIFAVGILSYIVWHEPAIKARYASLTIFAMAASALYLIHLACSIARQVGKDAEHDQFSGASNLLLFLPAPRRASVEAVLHRLLEPGLTMLAGFWFINPPLGNFLFISGASLAVKESINAWLTIRTKKRLKDSLDETEEKLGDVTTSTTTPIGSGGRTEEGRVARRFESEASD